MKNITIAVLLIATIALGALSVMQRGKAQKQATQLAEAETRLAAVEAQLKEKTEAIESAKLAETKAKVLQETLSATAAGALDRSNQIAQLQQSLATAKTNTGSNPLADMLKDPAMKEMIKSQQKLVLGPMIDKMYSELAKQLNLSPEQTSGLKELLLNKMMAGAEMGMSLMDGSADAAKRVEIGRQIKADMQAFDSQIKEYLGEENYRSFEAYEKTTPDRMAVGQFREQLASSSTPLTADQERQLVQAMNQERTNFKWSTDYQNKQPGDPDFAQIFSEEKLNQFAREKAQFDQQFIERAKQILTPDQIALYESYQATQTETQIGQMKMAAKLFGQ